MKSQLVYSVVSGAPLIHGQFRHTCWRDRYNSGCFADVGGGGPDYGSNNGGYIVDFNASRSSAVYGRSSTITPESRQTVFLIRY